MRIHVAEKSVTSTCQLCDTVFPHLVGDIGTSRSLCRFAGGVRW